MRLSFKVGALCAVAAFIPLVTLSLLILYQVSSHSRRESLEKLKSDSRVAVSLCDKRLVELRSAAQALADDIGNRALVSGDNDDRDNQAAWARLQDLLPRAQNDSALDFVIVTDPLGRVIARHNDRPIPGETMLGTADKNPIAEKIISGGNLPAAGCVVESGERSARLGLNRIAEVQLADGSTVDSALMLEAGAPIFSGGRFVGVVLVAQMLNTYYRIRPGSSVLQIPLVAEARQALYRNNQEDAGAVVALNKAIVASTIPPDGSSNSARPGLVGTLHETNSIEEDYEHGSRSYSIAWQPLKAVDGAAVGAIGIARPSKELEETADTTGTTLFVVSVIASLLAAAAGFLFGRGVGARLDDLRAASTRWSLGELSAPATDSEPFLARWVPSAYLRDEVADLAEQLEQTRQSFRLALDRIRKR